MPVGHQLAAIIFTDIVGYTAIMQRDENAALEKVQRFRQILESRSATGNGTIIQYYGDGCLLLFNSSVDAVRFAVILQKEFNDDPVVPARIGIHTGDVVLKEGNVYGDAVNIASRIQSLAPTGGIWVSEQVYKNIANKQNIIAEFVKTESLKNVKEPVRIYQVKTEIPRSGKKTVKAWKMRKAWNLSLTGILLFIIAVLLAKQFSTDKKGIVATEISESAHASIAVLPFDDNSPGKDQEYLGDGIAEEILNVLAQVSGLKVKGRGSSFSFKGKEIDNKAIGSILGVNYILKGSIQKFGLMIRIYTQLINTEGDVIWSEKFERELKDIFIVQDEIATRVSEKLKLTLLGNENAPPRQINTEAYELVLKGNLFFNKGDFQKAIESYTKAIRIDSNYAYPYIRMGWVIYQLTLFNQFTPQNGFLNAEAYIRKGLRLNPTLPEKQSAHHNLSYIYLWQYKWKDAKNEYELVKKTSSGPNTFYAFYQTFLYGNSSEGVSIIKKGFDQNPFDLLLLRDLSVLLYLDRKYEEAIQTCDKILEIDSTFSEAYRLKGTIQSIQGKFDLALYNLEKAEYYGNPWATAMNIITLARLGKVDEAKNLFSQTDTAGSSLPAFSKGLIYFNLGEKEKAFRWLQQSYNDRDFWLVSLKVDPIWDDLRTDKRFFGLIGKMNFPQ